MDPSSRLRMKPLWGFCNGNAGMEGEFCLTMSLNFCCPKKLEKWKRHRENREIFVELTGDIPADVVTLLGFLQSSPLDFWCFPCMWAMQDTLVWGCLRYVGNYTTQLYRDYTKPLIRIPKKATGIPWKVFSRFFFRGSCGYLPPIPFQGVDGRVGKFVWHSGCRGRRRDGMAMKKVGSVDRKNSVILTVSFCGQKCLFSYFFWMWLV